MQPKKKTRKRKCTFNQFSLSSARERATENRDKVLMGPSRGYVVQKEESRKLCHDGAAACYEKWGKLDRQTAEGEKRQFRCLLCLR